MNIAIVAGEPSGDRYAGRLIKALRHRQSDLTAFGLGGPALREAGVEIMTDMTPYAFMGFVDPIRHYPKIKGIMSRLLKRIASDRPRLVVLVDYPGFNLRVAKAVHRMGIPVVYFMVPQVWAWGAHRLAVMRETVRLAVVGLPFEEAYFKKAGVNTAWVGHPLVDMVSPTSNDKQGMTNGSSNPSFVIRQSSMRVVGLFPGSRISEVKSHWPVMVEALTRLRPGLDLKIIVAKSASVPMAYYRPMPSWIEIVENRSYQVMDQAGVLVMASGTVTLEAAFFRKPMVVMYKVSPVTYHIFKRLVTIPYICLINLIAKKGVVPELIQRHATPAAVEEALRVLWRFPEKQEAMRHELDQVVKQLGLPGVFDRAAKVMLECL